MLQYKMLEAPRDSDSDWIYTPDDQFREERDRMRRFAIEHTPASNEYRLNPAVFYLKFVKRDGAIRRGGIIMPIDHYDRFEQDPAAHGPRGGLRIGYDALDGRYMREQPFIDLISAGYIGAYAETSERLMTLVRAIVGRGRAVVAAIQTRTVDDEPSEHVATGGDDLTALLGPGSVS